jgi:hypothetical protein
LDRQTSVPEYLHVSYLKQYQNYQAEHLGERRHLATRIASFFFSAAAHCSSEGKA